MYAENRIQRCFEHRELIEVEVSKIFQVPNSLYSDYIEPHKGQFRPDEGLPNEHVDSVSVE